MARRAAAGAALGLVACGLVACGLVACGLVACGSSEAPGPPQPVCGQATAGFGHARPRAQCGPTADYTPINQYTGPFLHAQDNEDAVALIDGNCTGTLIAAAAGPVVLTAGHCFPDGGTGLIEFNFEDAPDGDPLATMGTVVERADTPDFALLALTRLPAITPTQLTRTPSARLAIIQHPRARPKVIAEGDYLAECRGVLSYTDLDTDVGSSGAGVLTESGYLLGVHTDGDCKTDGSGLNDGWSAEAIVAASSYLTDSDLTDR